MTPNKKNAYTFDDFKLSAKFIRTNDPSKIQELYDKQLAEISHEERKNSENLNGLCKYFGVLGSFIIILFTLLMATGWR